MPINVSVTINPDGSITIEPKGYRNNKCLAELEKLLQQLDSLGVETKITQQQLKPEAYHAGQRATVNSKTK